MSKYKKAEERMWEVISMWVAPFTPGLVAMVVSYLIFHGAYDVAAVVAVVSMGMWCTLILLYLSDVRRSHSQLRDQMHELQEELRKHDK